MAMEATFDIRRPPTVARQPTIDCRQPGVGCHLAVGRRMSKVVCLAAISLVFYAFADDAVSPAFTFDARYSQSGLTPDAWVSYEAEGLSSRFSAATVTRAIDSNNNGIPDEWESQYGLAGANAAADADPDNDGRTNIEEYNAGTNPIIAENYLASVATSARHVVDTWIESTASGTWNLVEVWGLSGLFSADTAGRAPDTDKDGIPDWWEGLYGLNPNVVDSHLDPDGDGRTNLQEYNAGTNPIVANDWTLSIAESGKAFTTDTRVWYTGGNPSFDETFAVVKVSNGFVCDTGGLYYDWDGDGIPNWCSDGMSNYGEFVAYTVPTNSNSKFSISIVPVDSGSVKPLPMASLLVAGRRSLTATGTGGFAVKWHSAKGRRYAVYSTDSLVSGFGVTPVAEFEGTGDDIEYVVNGNANVQFFKVDVRLSE